MAPDTKGEHAERCQLCTLVSVETNCLWCQVSFLFNLKLNSIGTTSLQLTVTIPIECLCLVLDVICYRTIEIDKINKIIKISKIIRIIIKIM